MPDYSALLNKARKIKKRAVKKRPKAAQTASEITDAEFCLIGSIAVINDLCDWLGLDLILFRLVDLITAAILGLWCLVRLGRFPSARFAGTFLIELIPVLGDISPTWTIFIISIYAEQKGYLPNQVN